MRLSLVLLILISTKSFAQSIGDDCKGINDIATMERLSHERLASAEQLTFASNNFDIKYYRLEWEVDPAVRYITGKVTAYYVITSSTNTISFDLVNSGFTVDSVKQRSTTLTKQHAANVLQITFPSTVAAGTFDSLSIFYKGVPPNTGFGSFEQ